MKSFGKLYFCRASKLFMKNVIRAVIGLVIIAIGIFIMRGLISMKSDPPVSAPPRPVKLVKTMRAVLSSEAPVVYVQGRVRALDRIEVFSEVTGVIQPQQKPFRSGTYFSEGEVMLRLDDSEQRLTLMSQRSGFLQLLTGALADFKIDFPDRFETWRAYTASVDVKEFLPMLPEPASETEKFFLSNRSILNQYYTIRSAEERLSKYVLRAPFNGEVSNSLVNPGALVRVGQKLGDFVSTNRFEIESAIPGNAIGVVSIGDRFEADQVGRSLNAVKPDPSDSEAELANTPEFTGDVLRLANTIDPNTQTTKVFLQVESENLRDGMYLSGAIYGEPVDSVLRIPLELLTPDDQLYAVKSDTLLTMLPVQVVYRSSNDALVRGVATGTPILAEPLSNAYDGMVVKVTNQ